MERRIITGISCAKNEVHVTLEKMEDHPGLSATIFGALAKRQINVDMIVQNISFDGKRIDITFTTSKDDLERVKEAIEEVKGEINYENLKIDDNIAKISAIGVGMTSNVGIAHKMFEALAKKNINMLLISTSEIKISTLIPKEYAELAVRVLHDTFELDQRKMK